VITDIKDKQVWVTVPELGTNVKVAANGHKNLAINQSITIGRPVGAYSGSDCAGSKHSARNTKFCGGESDINQSCYFNLKTNKDSCYRIEAAFPRGAAPTLIDGLNYYLYLAPEQIVIITNWKTDLANSTYNAERERW